MFQKPESDVRIEAASNRVLLAMEGADPNSPEYETLVNRLSDLNSIKVNNTKSKLSKDALLTVAANIAGIVLILQYERLNIVGSKALTFVQKAR